MSTPPHVGRWTDAEIAAEVAKWPPLTPQQKERLSMLLRPGVLAAQRARRDREAAARRGGAADASA